LPGSWNSITDQDGGGWSEVTGTAQTISEQNLVASKTLQPNASINLGNIYDETTGAEDITFSYSLANESWDRPGQVVFDGGFKLRVNKQDGSVSIINNEPLNLALDGYVIQSPSGVLGGTWNSLQDQSLAGWEEIASSDANARSEVNLDSFNTLNANGGSLGLGSLYSGGNSGAEDLTFTFSVGNSSIVATGEIEYIGAALEGDYNSNGVVDAADYNIWRDTLGSTSDLRADGNDNNMIDAGDHQVWKTNFGSGSGGAGTAASVPEPATWLVALAGIAVFGVRRLRR
jgi:hypothetical protein